jgi:hypothetical protein
MIKRMRTDDVPLLDYLLCEFGILTCMFTSKKEVGLDLMLVENFQYRRCAYRVWPIVERERYLPSARRPNLPEFSN